MIFAREYLADCMDDIEPLLAAHYAEVGFTHRGRSGPLPLEIDWDAYRNLASVGILRGYTARLDGALIAYAAFVVAASNLHHKGLKCASLDVLSVVPAHRGLTGSRLMAYCERQLKAEGVSMMTICVPRQCDWTPLAERWGYEHVETYMQKGLNGD